MQWQPAARAGRSLRRLTLLVALSLSLVVILAGGAANVGKASASQNGFSAATPPYWLLHGPGITTFGPFAGYVWRGRVHSIAGSWTVPSAVLGSDTGFAATWIGAQAPGGNKAPFMQIGTNNFVVAHIRRVNFPSFEVAWYSDTKLGFHPHELFEVHQGDAITARMTLTAGRWHLMIVDHTHRHRAALSTADDADAHFDQAEWLQEDPGLAGHRHAPYPTLSNVRFRRLRVNSGEPSYGRLRSTWMSANGIDLGPSPLVRDRFTLSPTQPSAIGMHYLQITVVLDVALRTFEVHAARWRPQTPPARIAAQQAALAGAIVADQQELAGAQWPGRAEALSQALVSASGSELAVLRTAPTLTPHGIKSWLRRWVRAEYAVSSISLRIRRVLGLPQLFPLPGEPL